MFGKKRKNDEFDEDSFGRSVDDEFDDEFDDDSDDDSDDDDFDDEFDEDFDDTDDEDELDDDSWGRSDISDEWDEEEEDDDDDDEFDDGKSSSFPKVAAGGLALILVVAVGAWMFWPDGDDNESVSAGATQSSSADDLYDDDDEFFDDESLTDTTTSTSQSAPTASEAPEVKGGASAAKTAVEQFGTAFYVDKDAKRVTELFDPEAGVTVSGIQTEIDAIEGSPSNATAEPLGGGKFRLTVDGILPQIAETTKIGDKFFVSGLSVE